MNLILTHETIGRQHRLVATCYKHGWRSMAYDPALSRADNHLAVAGKLAKALGGNVAYGGPGKLSETGGCFSILPANQRIVVLCNTDIPPTARKVRHKHSTAVAYIWQADGAWQVVVTAIGRSTLWATLDSMSAVEQHVTDMFEDVQATEASQAAIDAYIANPPSFMISDTDGVADEPEDDDPDPAGIAPAPGRRANPLRLVAAAPVNAVLNDPSPASVRVIPIHVEMADEAICASASVAGNTASRTIPYDVERSELDNHMAAAEMLAAAYGGHAVGDIGNMSFSLPVVCKKRHGVHNFSLKIKPPPMQRTRHSHCRMGANEQWQMWCAWKSQQIGRAVSYDETPPWAKPCTRADLFLVALQSGKSPADCLTFGRDHYPEAEAAMPVEEWELHMADRMLAEQAHKRAREQERQRQYGIEDAVIKGERWDRLAQWYSDNDNDSADLELAA